MTAAVAAASVAAPASAEPVRVDGARSAASLRYATQIDAFAYGDDRRGRSAGGAGGAGGVGGGPRLTGRIRADGASGCAAEAGRYHLYAGWACPRSHRATMVLGLLGLTDVVSVSYVHGMRDGRGWAFRESTGPDPVNGFTLLSQAYDATEANYRGAVTVPALWDRHLGRVLSNDPDTIDVDLATAFGAFADGPNLYPEHSRAAIDQFSRDIQRSIVQAMTRAVYGDGVARSELGDALAQLEERLSGRPFLFGEDLSLADLRLFAELVRYDCGMNAYGRAGPRLPAFSSLWAYLRRLYQDPAIGHTVDFASFTAPMATVADWWEPTERGRRGGPMTVLQRRVVPLATSA